MSRPTIISRFNLPTRASRSTIEAGCVQRRLRSTLVRLAELRLTIDRELQAEPADNIRMVRMKRLMLILKTRLHALSAAAADNGAHRARAIRIASAPRLPVRSPSPRYA